MPQDMWLYKYAQRLFDARLEHSKSRIFVKPIQPVYRPGCKSTRYILKCDHGVMAGLYYEYSFDSLTAEERDAQRKLIIN